MPYTTEAAQSTAYRRETCAGKDCVNAVTRELPHRTTAEGAHPEGTTKAKPVIVTVMIGYCDEHFRKIVAARLAARR